MRSWDEAGLVCFCTCFQNIFTVPLNTTLTTKIKYENKTEVIKIVFNINEHVLVKVKYFKVSMLLEKIYMWYVNHFTRKSFDLTFQGTEVK